MVNQLYLYLIFVFQENNLNELTVNFLIIFEGANYCNF